MELNLISLDFLCDIKGKVQKMIVFFFLEKNDSVHVIIRCATFVMMLHAILGQEGAFFFIASLWIF
jgi:hypothetical protein